MENYIQYQFTIDPINPWQEILLAELSLYDFDTFEEQSDGISAYLPESKEVENLLSDLWLLNHAEVKIEIKKIFIPLVNWNVEWESNFNPINVEDKCYIRANFHVPKKEFPYEIIIQPKMSFGTGHHETTYLMIQQMLELELADKSILDMGCGTGILAIFAKKMNAGNTIGIDIDDWAVENSNENKQTNQIEADFYKGDAAILKELNKTFDCILANINKNILTRDIPIYLKYLNSSGILLLSGILDEDFDDILKICNQNNLEFLTKKQKKSWISVSFKKNLEK